MGNDTELNLLEELDKASIEDGVITNVRRESPQRRDLTEQGFNEGFGCSPGCRKSTGFMTSTRKEVTSLPDGLVGFLGIADSKNRCEFSALKVSVASV